MTVINHCFAKHPMYCCMGYWIKVLHFEKISVKFRHVNNMAGLNGLRTLSYWWKKARIIMLGPWCYKRTAQVITTDNTPVPIIKFYYQFELFVLREICLQSKKTVSVVYNFVFLYPPQWTFAPAFIFSSLQSQRTHLPSFSHWEDPC